MQLIDQLAIDRDKIFKGAARIVYSDPTRLTSFPGRFESVMNPTTYTLVSGWSDFGATMDGIRITRNASPNEGIKTDQRMAALDGGDPDVWTMRAETTLVDTSLKNIAIVWESGQQRAYLASGAGNAQQILDVDAPATFTARMLCAIQEDPRTQHVRMICFRKVTPRVDDGKLVWAHRSATQLKAAFTLAADENTPEGHGQFGKVFEVYAGATVLSWPTTVYVATVNSGIYVTNDFSGPDATTQPVWSAFNAGLASDTDGHIHTIRFCHDAVDPTCLYAHISHEDDEIIYRSQSGGNWTKILNLADATALQGATVTDLYLCANRTVAGEVDVVLHPGKGALRSLDYGATWTKRSSVAWGSSYGLVNPLLTAGNTWHILNAAGLGGNRGYRSTDGGATWAYKTNNLGALLNVTSDGVTPYYRNTATTTDICTISFSSNVKVVLQDNLNLYGGDYDYGGMWISETNALHQRILRRLGTQAELYETTDSWATATLYGTYYAPVAFHTFKSLTVLNNGDSNDWMLFGYRTPGTSMPHSIYAIDQTQSPNIAIGKSGSMPKTPPYTNSIPYSAGGTIDGGIQYI